MLLTCGKNKIKININPQILKKSFANYYTVQKKMRDKDVGNVFFLMHTLLLPPPFVLFATINKATQ
jgi:hypothetical protein